MNSHRTRQLSHLLVAAILGITAFTLVLTVTDPPGPGLDPDAMAYMGAAESVAWQARYRVPAAAWWSADSTSALTHFPPGYPTVLALPVRLGMAPPQAARLVEALAAAVTIITLVLLVAEATTLLTGVLLGLALLVTRAMELVHLSVLSEPLFLACTALTLAAMVRARRPLAIGIPAALGALTRYAGVVLVGAGALWALVPRGSPAERLRRAAWALLPALLLQGAWVLRTRRLHEPGEIRHFAWYGSLGPTLRQSGATIRDWLVPDPGAWSDPIPYRPAIAFAAVIVVAAIVVMGTRRAIDAWNRPPAEGAPSSEHEAPARLLAACALLIVCYIGMLVVSRLFADPGIPFDSRILAPAVLIASVAIATCMALWWRHGSSMVTRIAVGIAIAGWALSSAATNAGEVQYALGWGSDLAGEEWQRSELLDWARTTGATHPLYSNWPSAVYFHLHRPSRYVPPARDTALLAAFADTLRATDGRAIVFTVPGVDYMTRETLERAPGLRIVTELEDGVVLAAATRK